MNYQKKINRVLKYLSYILNNEFHYTTYPTILEMYNDAYQISNSKDLKSTDGYVFIFGGGVIS